MLLSKGVDGGSDGWRLGFRELAEQDEGRRRRTQVSSSDVEWTVLAGVRAQQEGGGEPPTEGDASTSRSHQEVIQKALNPKRRGRTERSACSGRDGLTFGGESGKGSRCLAHLS